MARRSQRLSQRLKTLRAPPSSHSAAVSPYFPRKNKSTDEYQILGGVEQGSVSVSCVHNVREDSGHENANSIGENDLPLSCGDTEATVVAVTESESVPNEFRNDVPDTKISDATCEPVTVHPKASPGAKVVKPARLPGRRSTLAGLAPREHRRRASQQTSRGVEELETPKTVKRLRRNTLSSTGNHLSTLREPHTAVRNHSSESESNWSPSDSLSETDGSSDNFESVKPAIFRSRLHSGRGSLPAANPKVHKAAAKRRVSCTGNPNNVESDTPDDWEDVETGDPCDVKEVDFMQSLLTATTQKENVSESNSVNTVLTVSVPKCSLSSRKLVSDPELLARREALRQLKETFNTMHQVHVLCFLAHVRFLNSLCDATLYRGVGISLLYTAHLVLLDSPGPVDIASWNLDHLQSCVTCILSHKSSHTEFGDSSPDLTLLYRVANCRATPTDLTILFVSALRALGFDVRLVAALTPLPMNPSKTAQKAFCTPDRGKKVKKSNRKIVSSSSSDEGNSWSPSSNSTCSSICTFAEVYLPSLQRWVCVQFTSTAGFVDHPLSVPPRLYVVGVTSVRSCGVGNSPYVGRNPVDLAGRYDPDWCIKSRSHRLSLIKWNQILQYQRHLFDLVAAKNGSLVVKTADLVTVLRDFTDEQRIRSELLLKPLPDRVQDFKNHPLYALPRHLLKFEVIYPSDAPPLGFFRNEPVYHRECVHVCSTRETWLKEAKVVRLHEKPVKVVKARMSMKRKLLQGTSNSEATVELFGPWQLEDYKPPIAQNGVVPRNIHGTVDMFKPCMLPIGCAHICLTGIQYVAKKLGIDCAPAIVGWTFKGSGWAIPTINGYIVCKENTQTLIDAWRTLRMNAAKAAAEERSSRAIDNWRRLVRGLFLWHKVKAQFALAALHDATPSKRSKSLSVKMSTLGSTGATQSNKDSFNSAKSGSEQPIVGTSTKSDATASSGWQSLTSGHSSPLVTLPRCLPANISKPDCHTVPSQQPRRKRGLRSRRKVQRHSSTSEETDEATLFVESPTSDDSDPSFTQCTKLVTSNTKCR